MYEEKLNLTTIDDAETVNRLRAGDLAAFGDLYDRYARLVRSLCYDGTGNLSDSQELCQDVFMKAYRQIHSLREPSRFGYWLTGITRNAIKDWQRRSARDRLRFVIDVPDVHDSDTREDAENGLLKTISELPENERLALHLFYLDEVPASVAREILGLSQSGFYKLLDRARKRVEELLTDAGENSDE